MNESVVRKVDVLVIRSCSVTYLIVNDREHGRDIASACFAEVWSQCRARCRSNNGAGWFSTVATIAGQFSAPPTDAPEMNV